MHPKGRALQLGLRRGGLLSLAGRSLGPGHTRGLLPWRCSVAGLQAGGVSSATGVSIQAWLSRLSVADFMIARDGRSCLSAAGVQERLICRRLLKRSQSQPQSVASQTARQKRCTPPFAERPGVRVCMAIQAQPAFQRGVESAQRIREEGSRLLAAGCAQRVTLAGCAATKASRHPTNGWLRGGGPACITAEARHWSALTAQAQDESIDADRVVADVCGTVGVDDAIEDAKALNLVAILGGPAARGAQQLAVPSCRRGSASTAAVSDLLARQFSRTIRASKATQQGYSGPLPPLCVRPNLPPGSEPVALQRGRAAGGEQGTSGALPSAASRPAGEHTRQCPASPGSGGRAHDEGQQQDGAGEGGHGGGERAAV